MPIDSFDQLVASKNQNEIHDYLDANRDVAVKWIDELWQTKGPNSNPSSLVEPVAMQFPQEDPLRRTMLDETDRESNASSKAWLSTPEGIATFNKRLEQINQDMEILRQKNCDCCQNPRPNTGHSFGADPGGNLH
jgi:hypothetical protein